MVDHKHLLILGVTSIFVGGILGWIASKTKKMEWYGAMKNIRQIPFNDCERVCKGHKNRCVSDFIDADPTWCERKEEACVAECYYTPYHQLQG